MVEYTIMSYTIENMLKMFSKNKLRDSDVPRANDIAKVTRSIDPHILGIVDYDSWVKDIDDDGIKEVCEFERVPLQAIFRIKGTDKKII